MYISSSKIQRWTQSERKKKTKKTIKENIRTVLKVLHCLCTFSLPPVGKSLHRSTCAPTLRGESGRCLMLLSSFVLWSIKIWVVYSSRRPIHSIEHSLPNGLNQTVQEATEIPSTFSKLLHQRDVGTPVSLMWLAARRSGLPMAKKPFTGL